MDSFHPERRNPRRSLRHIYENASFGTTCFHINKRVLIRLCIFVHSDGHYSFPLRSSTLSFSFLAKSFQQNGNLDSYYPSSVLVLFFFFALLLWSNEGTNSVRWLHRMVHFFIASEAQLYGKLPEVNPLLKHILSLFLERCFLLQPKYCHIQ